MSATRVAPPKAVRRLTDDPVIEAQPVRGLIFGLLIAALFWLLMAGLAIALF
ncbi:MAG TPA: hypothetical protein VES03_04130 [Motilibacterales bacterium]|nr:hypothetical protein [Motilibacterales bacterium]